MIAIKKIVLKTVIGILLVCSLFVGFLYISSDIGIASGNLETDIRSSQKIKEDWAIDGSVWLLAGYFMIDVVGCAKYPLRMDTNPRSVRNELAYK